MTMWDALTQLYDDLIDRKDACMAPVGWAYRMLDASVELWTDSDGIHSKFIVYDKKNRLRRQCPSFDRPRTNKPFSQFLADKAAYALNLSEKKGVNGLFLDVAEDVLKGVSDPDVNVFLSFLRNGDADGTPDECTAAALDVGITESSMIGFRANGRWLDECPAVIQAWNRYYEQDGGVFGMDALTGEPAMLADTCRKLGGASLISCDVGTVVPAWGQGGTESCGISREQMRKATTVLQYLMSDVRNDFPKGDCKYLSFRVQPPLCRFGWVENLPDDMPSVLSGLIADSSLTDADQLKLAFDDLHAGRLSSGISLSTHYYVLDLDVPSKGRCIVRDFRESTFGELEQNVKRYLEDTGLSACKAISPYSFLMCSVSGNDKRKRIQKMNDGLRNNLVRNLFNSVLCGQGYDRYLFSEILMRLKKDGIGFDDSEFYEVRTRIAYLKAYLMRNRKELLMKGLNTTKSDAPYLCGRLFALYERYEQTDVPDTVPVSGQLSAMAATPATVLATLPGQIKPYRDKMKAEIRMDLDRQLDAVYDLFRTDVPKRFRPAESAMFYVGYYQQRQALRSSFAKKNGAVNQQDEKQEEKDHD